MPLYLTRAHVCIDNVRLLPTILERCRAKSKLKHTASSAIPRTLCLGSCVVELVSLTLVALQGVPRCARSRPNFTHLANRTGIEHQLKEPKDSNN